MRMPNTVDLLIDMARKKRDQAASLLAESVKRVNDAERKLNLLNRYMDDYHLRRRTTAETDMISLTNLHAFLAKLDAAVAQQKQEVLGARRIALNSRQEWEKTVQHLRSIEVLQERRAATVRLAESRIQQKQHDELSTRRTPSHFALVG